MNIFVLDKNLNIIDKFSSEGDIQKISPFFNDVYKQYLETGAETFKFTCTKNNNIEYGNYIAFIFDNKYKLFQISDIDETHEQNFEVEIYCEFAGIELTDEPLRARTIPSANIKQYLETVLADVDWHVGYVDDDIVDVYTIEIKKATKIYSHIQETIQKYDCEIEFRVELKGNRVIGKFIDVYKRRGLETNVRIEYGKVADKVSRRTTGKPLSTALIGYGKDDIDFKSVEWSKSKGNPCDKPLGQDWIGDDVAYRKYNKNGNHIMNIFDCDSESPDELLKLTYRELQNVKEPQVDYGCNVAILNYSKIRLGDTVYVIDNEFGSDVLHLSARVNTLEISFTDETKNKVEFSNYKKVKSKITPEMRSILNQIPSNTEFMGISKGGLLSSDVEADGFNIKVKNKLVNKDGKEYYVRLKDKEYTSFMNNVLPHDSRYITQSFAMDFDEGCIYTSQVVTETNPEHILISKISFNGNVLGYMRLHGFGHGSQIGIDKLDGVTKIWCECYGEPHATTGKLFGTKICRFTFEHGKEYTKSAGNVFDMVTDARNIQVSVSEQTNRLSVKYITYSNKNAINVYDLKSVIDNDPRMLASFTIPSWLETSISPNQGHSVYSNRVYHYQGGDSAVNESKARVTIFDFMGNVLDSNIILNDINFDVKEPEGLFVRENNGIYELYAGMSEGVWPNRKYHIYKFIDSLDSDYERRGSFIHNNGYKSNIEEVIINTNFNGSDRRKAYLLFTDKINSKFVVANFKSGKWWVDTEEYTPGINDAVIAELIETNDRADITLLTNDFESIKGEDGDDAYTVNLTNENHTATCDNEGNLLDGEIEKVKTEIHVFKGTQEVPFVVSKEDVGCTSIYDSNSKLLKVTHIEDMSATVTLNIRVDNVDFTKVMTISKATKGDTGEDSYAVDMTNDNYSFNCDAKGNIASVITTTTVITAFKGVNPVVPTIGTLPTVAGLTLSKSNGIITIKANTGTSLADNGSFDIPVTVGGNNFIKTFSWTKVKNGSNGSNGVSVTSTDVEYAQNTSATTAPTTGWTTTAPTWQNGKYIWSRTKTVLSNGTTKYTNPACITGQQGNNGATGTGVTSITEEYYLSTSKTTQSGGSWVTTPPTWSTGKYMWTRSKMVYKNPTSTEYTTPVCDSSWEAVNEIQVSAKNLILGGRGNKKTGLFKPSNFIVNEDYAEFSLTSLNGAYPNINIGSGFLIPIREYDVGKQVTWSFDIMITQWDIAEGKNLREWWMGQRYGAGTDESSVGAWRNITKINLPIVGEDGVELNKWVHITKTITIPSPAHESISSASLIQFSCSGTGTATVGARLKNVMLSYGNKEVGFIPATEDTENEIKDVSNSLGTLEDSIKDAFGDGIINDSEARALASNVQILNNEKSDVDKEYSIIYANTYLEGIAKTNLATAKTEYDSTHSSLISSINTAIGDKIITDSERNSVNSFFNTYRTKLATLRQRIQEANDYISTNKVDNVQISTRNILRYTRDFSQLWGSNPILEDVNGFKARVLHKANWVDGGGRTMVAHYLNSDEIINNLKAGTCISISGWIYIDSSVPLSDDNSMNNIFVRLYSNETSFIDYCKIPFIDYEKDKWIYFESTQQIKYDAINKSASFNVAVHHNGKVKFMKPTMVIGSKPLKDWIPAPEDNENAIGETIKTVDVMYYLSTSQTSLAGGNWSTTAPTWANGKYMWSKTVTTLANGTVKESSPTCIAGAKGDTGSAGKGVKSIVEQYYLSTSQTSLSGGSWSTTVPAWQQGKYIWTRSVITYTDNTTTTTNGICVSGSKGDKGDKGDAGTNGTNGVNGTSPVLVTITGQQSMKYLDRTSAPVPSTITLTANVMEGNVVVSSGMTYIWQYKNSSGTWVNLSGTYTSKTYSLTHNNTGFVNEVAQVRVAVSYKSKTHYLEHTVTKIYDNKYISKEEVFDKITEGGTNQLIYKDPDTGEIYMNITFAKTGQLIADLIKGGILTLGGTGNSDTGDYGRFRILDSTGQNELASMDGGEMRMVNLQAEELNATNLNVKNINCVTYAPAIYEYTKVYVNTTSGNDDVDFESGAIFKTLQGALDAAPKNLNGFTTEIVLQTAVSENIVIRGFSGGTLNILMNSKNINGYVVARDCSAQVFILGGLTTTDIPDGINNTGLRPNIQPSQLFSFGGYNYSFVAIGCPFVYVRSVDIFGKTGTTTNYCGGSVNGSNVYVQNVNAYASNSGWNVTTGGKMTTKETYGRCERLAYNVQLGGVAHICNGNSTGAPSNIYTGNGGQVIQGNVTFVGSGDVGSNNNTTTNNTSIVLNANYGDSYKVKYSSWRKDNSVRQGDWSSTGMNKGCWFFGNQFADLKGKTIKSVKLTLQRQSGGNSGTVAFTLKMHNHTGRPSGAPSYLSEWSKNISLTVGQSTTITITDSAVLTAIKNGTMKGFGIEVSSTSNSYYGILTPKLKAVVTY